jgi:hypothetical protein
MSIDWSFVLTPEFVIGTVIAGLLLNIFASYAVRLIDRLWTGATATSRKVTAELAERRHNLTERGKDDFTFYLALIAEAGLLRIRAMRRFLNMAGFTFVMSTLWLFREETPGIPGFLAAFGIVASVVFILVNWTGIANDDRSVGSLETVLRDIRTANGMKIEE